ncbi:MAG: L,D-transpeptidase family protein [Candidatus Omnitrophota bacterium]
MVISAGCGQAGNKISKMGNDPGDDLYRQAKALETDGKTLDAKTAYQQILADHADLKNIEQIQQDLYDLNMKILLSNIQTPKTVIHTVVAGDTLGKICKQYNITMALVKISNGLTSDVVRLGQRLRIWTGKFSIHVDKSQNTLILKSDDEVIKRYNVSTGANNSTPVGTFKIVTKLEDPVWYKAGAAIPPESPENVLGSRWMGFDIPSYGIHGTVQPDKIGQQVTAGCVRMRNQDVEELFKIVPRGTPVIIAD